MFINRDTALRRIARNRRNTMPLRAGTTPELRPIYSARHDAIVQTWAEITDQTFAEALHELQSFQERQDIEAYALEGAF